MRQKPSGFTISSNIKNLFKGLHWRFGCSLHQVRFADHRSGWSGLNFDLCFGPWRWSRCVLNWKSSIDLDSCLEVLSLSQQIKRDHDRWSDYDRKIADQDADEDNLIDLYDKMIKDHTNRHG